MAESKQPTVMSTYTEILFAPDPFFLRTCVFV